MVRKEKKLNVEDLKLTLIELREVIEDSNQNILDCNKLLSKYEILLKRIQRKEAPTFIQRIFKFIK